MVRAGIAGAPRGIAGRVSEPFLLILPALAAVGYVMAALFLKRALSAGCSQAQANVVANLVPAILFQLLWLGAGPVHWAEMWRPAVATLTFLVGQIFTFRALRDGEVSVATPLLGTKVVFTAIFSATLFAQAVPARWWLGAAASTAGVILVTGATWRSLLPRLREADAMYALGAASAFALTDVLVQHWVRALGLAVFVPTMFGLIGVASLALFLPGAGRNILVLPRPALMPLLVGSVLLGGQALFVATALALHRSATVVNIVYSSRAVWSVVLAWWLARWFEGAESRDAPAVLRRRLAGSLLVFAAVIAVLV
jgi:drug/metabolite transporter (DMT)-like permease